VEIGGSPSGALFSDKNRKCRYSLWRIWDKSKGPLLFIGLNPSTANDIHNDPTIIRLANFAKAWGYGGLYAGNLFSLVSSNPAALFYVDAVEFDGGPNDKAIIKMRELCSVVMVGWGSWGIHARKQISHVLSLVGSPIYCLKVTRKGEPAHPLYFPKDSKLTPYSRPRLD